MTTIITPPRAAEPPSASLLEIQALLGQRPRASIVLYLRRRRRPPAALRVDLPRGASNDPEELARALTGLVAGVSGAFSAEILVYGRESDSRAAMSRYNPLLRAIHGRFRSAGFEVPRTCLVAGESWCTVDVVSLAPMGWRRMPRSAGGSAPSPGTRAEAPPDPHHGPFVPITPASERRRSRAMAAHGVLTRALPGSLSIGDDAHPAVDDVVEMLLRWNAVLAADAPLPSDARSVALLWSLRHRVVRDGVLMLCAWGLDTAIVAVHEATEPAEATIGAATVYDTFLGRGRRVPEPRALRAAIDLLRHLVSCGPKSLAAPALTMLAWLEWARGRSSVADAYLEECRRADTDYRLARLLRVAIRHGFVPDWIGEPADAQPFDRHRLLPAPGEAPAGQ